MAEVAAIRSAGFGPTSDIRSPRALVLLTPGPSPTAKPGGEGRPTARHTLFSHALIHARFAIGAVGSDPNGKSDPMITADTVSQKSSVGPLSA